MYSINFPKVCVTSACNNANPSQSSAWSFPLNIDSSECLSSEHSFTPTNHRLGTIRDAKNTREKLNDFNPKLYVAGERLELYSRVKINTKPTLRRVQGVPENITYEHAYPERLNAVGTTFGGGLVDKNQSMSYRVNLPKPNKNIATEDITSTGVVCKRLNKTENEEKCKKSTSKVPKHGKLVEYNAKQRNFANIEVEPKICTSRGTNRKSKKRKFPKQKQTSLVNKSSNRCKKRLKKESSTYISHIAGLNELNADSSSEGIGRNQNVSVRRTVGVDYDKTVILSTAPDLSMSHRPTSEKPANTSRLPPHKTQSTKAIVSLRKTPPSTARAPQHSGRSTISRPRQREIKHTASHSSRHGNQQSSPHVPLSKTQSPAPQTLQRATRKPPSLSLVSHHKTNIGKGARTDSKTSSNHATFLNNDSPVASKRASTVSKGVQTSKMSRTVLLPTTPKARMNIPSVFDEIFTQPTLAPTITNPNSTTKAKTSNIRKIHPDYGNGKTHSIPKTSTAYSSTTSDKKRPVMITVEKHHSASDTTALAKRDSDSVTAKIQNSSDSTAIRISEYPTKHPTWVPDTTRAISEYPTKRRMRVPDTTNSTSDTIASYSTSVSARQRPALAAFTKHRPQNNKDERTLSAISEIENSTDSMLPQKRPARQPTVTTREAKYPTKNVDGVGMPYTAHIPDVHQLPVNQMASNLNVLTVGGHRNSAPSPSTHDRKNQAANLSNDRVGKRNTQVLPKKDRSEIVSHLTERQRFSLLYSLIKKRNSSGHTRSRERRTVGQSREGKTTPKQNENPRKPPALSRTRQRNATESTVHTTLRQNNIENQPKQSGSVAKISVSTLLRRYAGGYKPETSRTTSPRGNNTPRLHGQHRHAQKNAPDIVEDLSTTVATADDNSTTFTSDVTSELRDVAKVAPDAKYETRGPSFVKEDPPVLSVGDRVGVRTPKTSSAAQKPSIITSNNERQEVNHLKDENPKFFSKIAVKVVERSETETFTAETTSGENTTTSEVNQSTSPQIYFNANLTDEYLGDHSKSSSRKMHYPHPKQMMVDGMDFSQNKKVNSTNYPPSASTECASQSEAANGKYINNICKLDSKDCQLILTKPNCVQHSHNTKVDSVQGSKDAISKTETLPLKTSIPFKILIKKSSACNSNLSTQPQATDMVPYAEKKPSSQDRNVVLFTRCQKSPITNLQKRSLNSSTEIKSQTKAARPQKNRTSVFHEKICIFSGGDNNSCRTNSQERADGETQPISSATLQTVLEDMYYKSLLNDPTWRKSKALEVFQKTGTLPRFSGDVMEKIIYNLVDPSNSIKKKMKTSTVCGSRTAHQTAACYSRTLPAIQSYHATSRHRASPPRLFSCRFSRVSHQMCRKNVRKYIKNLLLELDRPQVRPNSPTNDRVLKTPPLEFQTSLSTSMRNLSKGQNITLTTHRKRSKIKGLRKRLSRRRLNRISRRLWAGRISRRAKVNCNALLNRNILNSEKSSNRIRIKQKCRRGRRRICPRRSCRRKSFTKVMCRRLWSGEYTKSRKTTLNQNNAIETGPQTWGAKPLKPPEKTPTNQKYER